MAMSDRTMGGKKPMQSERTRMRGGLREGFAHARVEARRIDAFRRNASIGKQMPWPLAASSALRRRTAQRAFCGEGSVGLWSDCREISLTSCGAGSWRRRGRPLRKNIIGHEMASGAVAPMKQFFDDGRFRNTRLAFALLNQQARHHGAGGFVDPLIKQRANLLAQIGSMTKTREFVTLERVARSGEKKLPRRLGLRTGHGRLLQELVERNSNSLVIRVNGTKRVLAVESCGKLRLQTPSPGCREAPRDATRERRAQGGVAAVRACSACAGDYEDPDRTAWAPEGAEDGEGNAPEIPDESPAEGQ